MLIFVKGFAFRESTAREFEKTANRPSIYTIFSFSRCLQPQSIYFFSHYNYKYEPARGGTVINYKRSIPRANQAATESGHPALHMRVSPKRLLLLHGKKGGKGYSPQFIRSFPGRGERLDITFTATLILDIPTLGSLSLSLTLGLYQREKPRKVIRVIWRRVNLRRARSLGLPAGSERGERLEGEKTSIPRPREFGASAEARRYSGGGGSGNLTKLKIESYLNPT